MHWQLSTYFLKAILLIAIAKPADPFGLNSTPTLPGSQTYNTPTQHPLQSQQPPQQVALYPNEGAVNPGTSYGQASQCNHMTSGWNGQVANHVAPPPQQTLNYDDQSGALPPPPWEAQSVPSNEVSNGQLGGMQSHTTPMSQIGGMQPLQPQISQTAGTQMQPAGFGNQFGSLPQHSMPGMQFAGMQPPLMPVAQQIMMYPQQMPGVKFGARPQQQIYGGQMAAYGYMQQPGAQQYYNQGRPMYGYPRTNDLSQKKYGLSMQDNSYMGMNSPYRTTPSPSSSMGQHIRPSKPEDKLFGDLINIAKTKQNKAS